MATVATQSPAITGTTLTYGACATGDKVNNNGKVFIHVKNGDASSHTVTVAAQAPCSFGVSNAAHDAVVAVGAGVEKIIGPFSKDQFNDANGQLVLSYSALTSMTIAAVVN